MENRPPIRYLDAGPSMPLADVRGAGRPMQAAGQVVSGALDFAGDLALKLKRQQEAGEIATYFANMNEEAAQFSADLLTRHDPENWLDDYKTKSREWQGKIGEQKWLPGTKARVMEDFTRWNSSQTANLAKQMAVRVLEEGRARTSNALRYFGQTNDVEGYERTAQEGRSAGFYGEAEYDRLMMEGDRLFKINEIEGLNESDPTTVKERLTAKNKDGTWAYDTELEIGDRKRLINQAEQSEQDLRREEMDSLELALDSGQLRERDIEAAKYLTPNDRKRWHQALEASDPPSSEVHSEAWDILFENREAFADPSISDVEYAKRWNETRAKVAAIVPKQYSGDINQELSYRSPANRKAVRSNPRGYNDPQELKSMGFSQVQRALKAGELGDLDDEGSPSEEAHRKAGILRMRVSQWVKKNPDDDGTGVHDYVDSLIRPERTRKRFNMALPSVPGFGVSVDGGLGVLPPLELKEELDQILDDGN